MKLRGLLLCLLLVGCAPAVEEDDEAEVVVGSGASAFSTSALKWINGSYSGCQNRSGAWSARVSGSATMDNPTLTVVKNDAACQLAITSVVADQTYAAAPAITLGTSYPGTASTFGSGGSTFLGNAKLETSGFSADFTLTFIFEDRTVAPTVTESTVSASFTSVTGYTVATSVTPSNYTLDVSNLKFAADPIKLIYGVTGTAVLKDATTLGTSYVVDNNTLGASPSFSEVQTAYNNAVLFTQKSITTLPQSIPAAEFGVVSVSLFSQTFVRNVIVKRTVGATSAYQVFRVTFSS